MHPQHRTVLWGADEEARRHDDIIVLSLGIHVLDAIDALDYDPRAALSPARSHLPLAAVRGDDDVHERHGDLRLLLAWQRLQSDEPDEHRRDEAEEA